jgi:hypothetical protein
VTKRMFTQFLCLYVLFRGAEGLIRMEARRLSATGGGAGEFIGDSAQIVFGR